MTLEYEKRTPWDRTYRKVVKEGDGDTGLFTRAAEELEPGKISELYASARELDYGSSPGLMDAALQRIVGGRLKTPYGTIDWRGSMPEDVQRFVEEIEEAIDS
ncbi:MAG: hypothetical protein ABEJ69_00515 [Candidatus Nanohaloarchaea archaeon]